MQIEILYPNGFLLSEGDPTPWIRRHPDRCQSVRHLRLTDPMWGGEKVIGDSIRELTKLTHLSIKGMDITDLPYKISSLRNLQILDLSWTCGKPQELPPNLGDLESLTSLSISCSTIEFLPDSLAKLSKLTKLCIGDCHYLEELPANLGELESLTQLTLRYCDSIKSLPDSVAELSKLTTLNIAHLNNLRDLPANLGELKSLTHLSIHGCISLKECPSNLNVVHLSLIRCCSIQSLPRGWSNLDHLVLCLCSDKAEQMLANLIYLRHLQLRNCLIHWSCVKELPANLDKLPQLSVLDIRESVIKCFPSSIMNLSQLRLLFLPNDFMLQTLPYQLHESLIITGGGIRVRKTWKELKKEMEIFTFPNVRVAPSEYLQLTVTEDSEQWFPNTFFSSMVRILELELMYDECGDNIIDLIAELPELTHLYICGRYFSHLPPTFAKLTHLSLFCEFKCDIESIFNSLGKLSTLEYLHLDRIELPAQMDLPVSLRHLSLEDHYYNRGKYFVPLPDSMTKLSNLKVLHLCGVIQLDILPENLNPEKLKLEDCDMTNIKSLPEGLKHVEIIHTDRICHCYKLEICFNQLVYVETLSITCHGIKFLPSIVGLHNLQVLQLKDCFSMKKLPPNLDLMVNLRTIDVSGTRIKSLPSSILNLPKLQRLILPKCFQSENLPLELKDRSVFDDTDDKYYKDMCYYDSDDETSSEDDDSEDDDNTTNTIARISISQQQISPHQLLYQPDVTPVLGDFHDNEADHPIGGNSHHTFCSHQNQETEIFHFESEEGTANSRLLNLQEPCFPSSQHALQPEHIASMTSEFEHGLPPNLEHEFSSGTGNNLIVSENLPLELRDRSVFDDTDDKYYKNMGYYHSDHETSSEDDDDTTNTIAGISKSQQQLSPYQPLNQPNATPVLEDSHGSIESEQLTADNRLLKIQNPCFPSSQLALHPEHGLPPNFQHDFSSGNGKNLLVSENGQNEDNMLGEGYNFHGKDHNPVTHHSIQRLRNQEMPKNIRVNEEVSKESEEAIIAEQQQTSPQQLLNLPVKLSTIKRRCRELGIKAWPSSRRNKRKASTEALGKISYVYEVGKTPFTAIPPEPEEKLPQLEARAKSVKKAKKAPEGMGIKSIPNFAELEAAMSKKTKAPAPKAASEPKVFDEAGFLPAEVELAKAKSVEEQTRKRDREEPLLFKEQPEKQRVEVLGKGKEKAPGQPMVVEHQAHDVTMEELLGHSSLPTDTGAGDVPAHSTNFTGPSDFLARNGVEQSSQPVADETVGVEQSSHPASDEPAGVEHMPHPVVEEVGAGEEEKEREEEEEREKEQREREAQFVRLKEETKRKKEREAAEERRRQVLQNAHSAQIAQMVVEDFEASIENDPQINQAASVESWLQGVLGLDIPKKRFVEEPLRWMEYAFRMRTHMDSLASYAGGMVTRMIANAHSQVTKLEDEMRVLKAQHRDQLAFRDKEKEEAEKKVKVEMERKVKEEIEKKVKEERENAKKAAEEKEKEWLLEKEQLEGELKKVREEKKVAEDQRTKAKNSSANLRRERNHAWFSLKGALAMQVVVSWEKQNVLQLLERTNEELARVMTNLEESQGQVASLRTQLEAKRNFIHTAEELEKHFWNAMNASRRCYTRAFPQYDLPYALVEQKFDERAWRTPLPEEEEEDWLRREQEKEAGQGDKVQAQSSATGNPADGVDGAGGDDDNQHMVA